MGSKFNFILNYQILVRVFICSPLPDDISQWKAVCRYGRKILIQRPACMSSPALRPQSHFPLLSPRCPIAHCMGCALLP